MRVFITGVSGFIGKKLAEQLVKNGIEVVGLSKNSLQSKTFYKVIVGDILDSYTLESVVKDSDCIVHLAAITAHRDIEENMSRANEVNLSGTKNVLELFNKYRKPKMFIYASTGKVYGRIEKLPITEEHPTNPLNILGKTKLETEKLIESYSTHEKSYVILRIFNVYGEGQKDNFLLPTIMKQLKSSPTITLGNIDVQRDYIYIDDVISLISKIVISPNLPLGFQKYNVSSSIPVSPKQIVEKLGTIIGRSISVKTDENRFRFDEEKVEYGSYNSAKIKFNWKPQITLEEGLRRLAISYELVK